MDDDHTPSPDLPPANSPANSPASAPAGSPADPFATSPGDSPAVRVRCALQRLHLAQQQHERRLATALGVDRTSLEIIYLLITDGPSTPTQLARRAHLSAAVTSQVLNRLQAAGHLVRTAHPADRRKLIATISPTSAQRAWQEITPLIDALDGAATHLAPDVLEAVIDHLTTVTDLYGDHTGTPPS